MLCIEVEDDSSFLWNDLLAPCHMRSGGHGRFCPICEKRIATKLKRHVEREHLLWWFNPTKAYCSCKQSVTSACFLRRDHAHCTPPANFTKSLDLENKRTVACHCPMSKSHFSGISPESHRSTTGMVSMVSME